MLLAVLCIQKVDYKFEDKFNPSFRISNNLTIILIICVSIPLKKKHYLFSLFNVV